LSSLLLEGPGSVLCSKVQFADQLPLL